MSQDKYSEKVKLTAVEISEISISLRESVRRAKLRLNEVIPEDQSITVVEEIKMRNEDIQRLSKLQKRFQRLAVKIEKEILKDIRDLER